MRRAILIATILTFVLSMSAYAVVPLTGWETAFTETFDDSAYVVGSSVSGVWGGNAVGFTKVVDDGGTQGKAVQITQATSSSGILWMGFGDGSVSQDYDVNRLSFKARLLANASTRTDRGVIVSFAAGEFANGTTDGNGFEFSTDKYAAAMGDGDLYVGATAPNSWAGTRSTTPSTWTSFDLVMYRNTVGSVAAGTLEWYVDGSLVLTKGPAETGEWVLGGDLLAPSRWMNSVEIYLPAKDTSGKLQQVLFDDISIQYTGLTPVPEPSSLLALSMFGVGALGFIKRRRA